MSAPTDGIVHADETQLAQMRARWHGMAPRFTETANKRVTLQCAQQMHTHLQLAQARDVLEVAAGGGLGSLDVVSRMLAGAAEGEKKTLVVTDLAPAMVALAQEHLKAASTETLAVQVMEANGQRLSSIASASKDRYIANMCLHLTPDPDALLREARRVLKADGLAGFTIWGKPANSAIFTISTAVSHALALSDGSEHANFAMGKDLEALRARILAAGFSKVMVWPFQCVLELWKGEEFAAFEATMAGDEDEEMRAKRFALATQLADEWLAKGFPIGLEACIIVARA